MDFMDILCPRFRYFNVCRAKTGWNYKTGARATCGYAFPQKMWYQFPGTRASTPSSRASRITRRTLGT
eukprot:1112635-Lingulodinium_polyedra.AAC.1